MSMRRSMRRRGRRRGRRRARRRTEARMAASAPYFDEGAPAEPTAAQTSASLDYDLDELERLAELKDRGVISEAEFNAKKREILGL